MNFLLKTNLWLKCNPKALSMTQVLDLPRATLYVTHVVKMEELRMQGELGD